MIKTYKEAIQLLYNHINKNNKRGEFGNERLKYFLKLLGNPQNSFPVIHVAGTSGKGSTAYTTSKILEAHGYNIGLHVSPHLLDIRERFQINNKLISKTIVTEVINKMFPKIQQCSESFFGPPTYFEITLSLCYMIFEKEKIDIAIIEAGCGGLLDGTNTCNQKNKICIITKQGLDHKNILGNTLEEITFNDAGIIKKNNAIISLYHKLDTCRHIVEFYTKKNNGELTYITKNKDYKIINSSKKGTQFTYQNKKEDRYNFQTNLLGKFQIENISIALKTCETFLIRKGKTLDIQQTKKVLKTLKRRGRFEKFEIGKKTIIIDGAHNPQKMKTFISSLKEIYPNKKFRFLIAIKGDKNFEDILAPILPIAKKIHITNFKITQDFFLTALGKETYQKFFSKHHISNRKYEKNPEKSLQNLVKSNDQEIIIITGSLYLLSILYPIIKKL